MYWSWGAASAYKSVLWWATKPRQPYISRAMRRPVSSASNRASRSNRGCSQGPRPQGPAGQ